MDKSYIDLFEEQVLKTPGDIAVIFEQEQLSYLELNQRSNQLAYYLRDKGVLEDTLVPLYIERGINMLVAMLGIMKAGGAYVPIDTDFPPERIRFMLKDTGAKMMVSSKESGPKLSCAGEIDIIEIENLPVSPTDNLPVKVLPHQLAYVIYTSGSTGVPKGVMIEQRNLVDYVTGLFEKVHINECRSFALVSTIATDLGNTVIYASLVSGGALHLFTKESVSNIEYLHRYFSVNKIDCLKIVASHWKALNMDGQLLLPEKLLVFGGEALPGTVVEDIRLSGSRCVIVNHYGPTETTIGKLLHIVDPATKYEYTVPIGKPFSNTKVLVLTKNLKLCPIGVPGQLYITGDGVARGYWNNPQLTNEKFIQNPFSKQAGSVMYSTGDMVKYLPDGNISFIGRADNQVKIRGYRIEPGEVEMVLQRCGLVSQAVVLANEDRQGNKRLVGYIVAEGSFDREGILSYLKEKLPEYMIPALLMELESFPLTANGKIDRNALPDPEAMGLQTGEYVTPRNEVEARLAALWQDVLEVELVGVNDDFFELGGHSLLAVRLVSAIRKAFAVEMPIGDIFDHPTVALLATQLANNTDNKVLTSIEVVTPRPGHIPLSFSQERLWFIDRLEGSIQYHVPAVLRLNGKLNTIALAYALQQIVNRHEVLRSVIREDEGQVYQYIKSGDNWALDVIDGSCYHEDGKSLQQYIQQLISNPFDLSKDDMFRATLIVLNKEEHILVATLHHIASDGWSRSILVKEVVELYNSHEEGRTMQLLPLKVQYADYAMWQRTNFQGEVFDRKLNYWKQKLEGVTPLQLPSDFKRPPVWATKGDSVEFKIDKELCHQLVELSQKQGTTLFMTLLACFKILLHRYSGQQDICVGTPIAGRQQIEVEDLIGFFVNTLALRSEIKSEITFKELLQQVRSTTLEAYENQEVPFEKVVDALVLERDISRNPLFQVMFVLRNTPEVPELRLGEVALSAQQYERRSTLFDITLFVTESEHGLQCVWEYSTSLYAEQTIRRMVSHFKELLNSIVTGLDQKIGILPMVSAGEKYQLLFEFNNSGTGLQYLKEKNIIESLEAQAANTPGASAVLFGNKKITYRELNERSNQVARYLRSKGVKEEVLVPIMVDRSINMITGILGILKAGGAYVPIDTEYPLARINYMLDDTNANIIVSSLSIISKLAITKNVEVIDMDADWPTISKQLISDLNVPINPHQLAYVIYTSGSTGKPKGVMLEHRNLFSFICWCREEFASSRFEIVYASTSICFDISLFEIFYTLSIGKPLRIIENGLHIGRYLSGDSFVLINTVPVVIENLLNEGTDLGNVSVINMAGEPVPWKVQESLDTESIETRNLYGPTEDTVYSTVYRLKNGGPILIGKPINNTEIYIIDKEGQLCPIGIAGEICIGGDGLARGYLNRPDLTKEKFVANPFSDDPRERVYKTGDLGRWMPDGNIDYLGRVDDQVKIRGYRIELGEIETALQQSGLVMQAAVLVKKDSRNQTRLVSYYVPNRDVVKVKERELYERQVEIWKEVYETEYAKTEQNSKDEEFNIEIWNNSFTGQPIEEAQMHEWLQDIVQDILSEPPGSLLEIGCGTGLIFYQLSGKVKKYIGTDFSRSSINQIKQRISKGIRDYGATELHVCAAHEVSVNKEEEINTVLLNSIIQYFPGEDYMSDVIGKSISLVNGKGRIIIGDVRDKRLLELFKYRLQIQKMQPSVSLKELEWTVEQDVLREEELCFSPEYFYNLQLIYPEITQVDIHWKNAFYENELSLYRYTVVMYVGIQKAVIEPGWQNWQDLTDRQNVIKTLLQNSNVVALKDVPNYRLWKERGINDSLKKQSVQKVADLTEIIAKEDLETIEITEIINVAKANGFSCRLLLDEDPLKVNLLMERNPSANFIKPVFSEKSQSKNILYTNIPLFTNMSALLQKEIKSVLRLGLPEYMVPSELIVLNNMPLNSNGKIDRRFLMEREDKAILNKINYKAPRTEIEQTLVNIWQTLLQVGQVGIHDNFFELGGHSLLAMRLVSAIRKELELEIAIKILFNNSTVSALAAYLESQTKGLLLPPIEPKPRPEHIPLSFSQERLTFIDSLEGTVQYHLPLVMKLKGRLNIDALTFALQQVINRHEVLRTVIRVENEQACQVIIEKDGWQLNFADDLAFEDGKALKGYIDRLINKPFDLSKDYMIRANLLKTGNDEHVLIVSLHHIAADGWSISVIIKEVVELYSAFEESREPALAPLPLQFADYSVWQRNYLQGEVLEKKLVYWKDKLAGVSPLQLPVDFVRPTVQSKRGAVAGFSIDNELTDQLQALSQQQGTTMFMTLLAVFKVLLYRYSGQQDICVGTPIAGRQHQQLEDLIGFFINTLVLRSDLSGDPSFSGLLQQVRTSTLEAYEHQAIPFEKLVEVIVKERDLSRSPLFQVMFMFQNTPEVPQLRLGEVALFQETSGHTTSKFELTFNIAQKSYGLQVSVEYCTDLFTEQTIRRLINHFKELLRSVVKTPEQKIGLLQMQGHDEELQLLEEFNATSVVYAKDESLIGLFEEQVLKIPGTTAILFKEKQLTYLELNTYSNQLAHYLVSKGIGKESLVPICIERGLDMVIGLLGILKAGGTFVPVDPEYPEDRIGYMLEDTHAAIVISSRKSRAKIPGQSNLGIIEMDGDWALISQQPSYNLQIAVAANQLAYIIYTSGSTGKPKGVMIEQKSVVNLLFSVANDVHFDAGSVFMSVTTFSFDICYLELFMPLILGGKLIIVSRNEAMDGYKLSENIGRYRPTHMQGTPSTWQLLMDVEWQNKEDITILVGGEALKEDLKSALTRKGNVWNLYGPTETTIWSTIKKLETNESVLIGKPIANTQIQIVSREGQLVPIGVAGEIMIGGTGLARGYYNRPELTADKFTANRYSNEPGARMYHTGDLGRWRADGNIECLGRIDEQVKIRGYRIELGEIETMLQQTGLVRQCVVLAREDKSGNKRLVGYIVSEGLFDKQAITAQLRKTLPEYMVPGLWVKLETLPLTPNGKINKKVLPDPDASELVSNVYMAPGNEVEIALVSIWKDLLQIERVGIHDNFFELGGHSLLAMRLIAAIRKTLQVELPLNDIFIFQSIAALADNIIEKSNHTLHREVDIKYLIPIKTGGNKIPLYIICGGGGTALLFTKLSEMMDKDQPVYALQATVDNKVIKKSGCSLEEIAERFIEEILISNPDGPYALSGHCLGGIIAFEMAKQLEARGKKVHMLAMFDSIIRERETSRAPNFKNFYNLRISFTNFISKVALKLYFETFLMRKHTRQAIKYKMLTFTRLYNRMGKKNSQTEDLGNIGLKIFEEASKMYVEAVNNYKMAPYQGEIILFFAKEHYYFMDSNLNVIFKKLDLNENTKNVWKQYAGSIKIYNVEGEHSTIFEPAHCREFARLLQLHLDNGTAPNEEATLIKITRDELQAG